MSGLEYITENLLNHPQCPHGPTLLFSKSIEDKRRFFACSACRDRKHCSFFLWEDKKQSYNKDIWEKEKKNVLPQINHRQVYITFNEIQQINQKLRGFCNTCNQWILSKTKNNHLKHDTQFDISDENILYPSKFLKPQIYDKKEAQYLFSDSTVVTITNILRNLQINNVLSIGAPTVHEHIQAEQSNLSSLLLDLDHRYHNFYGPLQFCWYNLFNHHFFLPDSKQVFIDFLQSNKDTNHAIIIDPPFGGRVEPIAQTLKQINDTYQKLNNVKDDLPIILFFPYFMEPQIRNSLPDFKMLDLKINYDNHPLFQNSAKGRKFGSPVRIFTNVSLSKIDLSKEDGYRFCSTCDRWVYKENKHCNICNACTSKDGRTYSHCTKCNRCVKPTWVHCEICNRCAQPDHKCGEIQFNQACFHCKEQGHKKTNCPKVNHDDLKRKRTAKMESSKKKKKCK